MNRELYDARIIFEPVLIALFSVCLILTGLFIFSAYEIFTYGLDYVLLLLFLPLLVLDAIVFPAAIDLLKHRSRVAIFRQGISVRGIYFPWDKVRSISFDNGRIKEPLSLGFLPTFQWIYLLDKSGKEYSAVIDIDYFLKKDRGNNNIKEIKKILSDEGRLGLLSDWAQG